MTYQDITVFNVEHVYVSNNNTRLIVFVDIAEQDTIHDMHHHRKDPFILACENKAFLLINGAVLRAWQRLKDENYECFDYEVESYEDISRKYKIENIIQGG